MERNQEENNHVEEISTSKEGSICGYESLHHLLGANLKPHLFKVTSSCFLELQILMGESLINLICVVLSPGYK